MTPKGEAREIAVFGRDDMNEQSGRYVGRTFGSYRLQKLIGKSGFSEVYLGEQRSLGTQAAIKILDTSLNSAEFERFRREAQTIKSLQHPGIARLFDVGIEGDTPFMAMSYAPRGSLKDWYPAGSRLPLETVVSLVNQIAAVLQYAHQRRVVHGNLKPENLLIGPDDEILLSDFGIELVLHNTQQPAGNVTYVAPEQLRKKAQPASDQYALAVLAYEWLCGEPPFAGSPAEVAARQLNEPPPSLRGKVSALPAAVEAVFLKALAKEPGQRFPTIEAFAQALEQTSVAEVPELAVVFPSPPAGQSGLASRGVLIAQPTHGLARRMNRLMVWLACLTVVASGGLFFWSTLGHPSKYAASYAASPTAQPTFAGKPTPPQPTEQPPRVISTVSTAFGTVTEFALPAISNGFAQGITAGPDGAIWFTAPNANEIGRIAPDGTVRTFGSAATTYSPAEIITGPDHNLWFTEGDGDHIGFMTPSGDSFGGYDAASSPPASMTVGPDGNIWFTQPDSNQIGRLSPQGNFTYFPVPSAGRPLGITTGPDGNIWFTEYLGDLIGRITPTGAIKEFALPEPSSTYTEGGPYDIITGADKNLWISEPAVGQIVKMTTSGAVQVFKVSLSDNVASGLTLGPDGNVWFTDGPDNAIGRITPSGSVDEVTLPAAASGLAEIAAGPNRTIWFGEYNANAIGRLTLNG
jgi:serine/threonine protein kinase/sugar lactone lactonase YvrE